MKWLEMTQTMGALSGLVCLMMTIFSLKKQMRTCCRKKGN